MTFEDLKKKWVGESTPNTPQTAPDQPLPAQPVSAPPQPVPVPQVVTQPAANTPQTAPDQPAPQPAPGIDPDLVNVLSGEGISPASIQLLQSFAKDYDPTKGGFYQQQYELLNKKPAEVDEQALEKRRKQAVVTDALSLLAQLGLTAAGGKPGERKFEETASGIHAKRAKELQDKYKTEMEKYLQGYATASGKDYELADNDRRDTRSLMVDLLKDAQNKAARRAEGELTHQRALERQGKQQDFTAQQTTVKHENALDLQDKRNDFTTQQTAAKHKNAQALQNGRNAFTAKENEKKRDHAFGLLNARLSAAQKKQKEDDSNTILFRASQGMPGAQRDPVSGVYSISLNLSPDEKKKLAFTAKDALTKNDFKGKPRDFNATKLSDNDAIRMYVQNLNPDVLYKEGKMPKKAFADLIKNPDTGRFYEAGTQYATPAAQGGSPKSGDTKSGSPKPVDTKSGDAKSGDEDELSDRDIAELAARSQEFGEKTGIRPKKGESMEEWQKRSIIPFLEWYFENKDKGSQKDSPKNEPEDEFKHYIIR